MLLRPPTARMREVRDPSHPHVRLSVGDRWSAQDLREVAGHLRDEDCVHVTLTVPHDRLLLVGRRRGMVQDEDTVRERLAELARCVGPDARRVMVRVQRQPTALTRWWARWAWRRGVGGSGRPQGREYALDELMAPHEPSLEEAGPCTGRPHVLAVAASPLSWDVIDELHRSVCAGREVHLVLTVPPSPVSRDPGLHVLWERRMVLDLSERQREVAQMWPDDALIRIEVARIDLPRGRGRRERRPLRRTP